jgi:DNA-binding NtrC family response regulator
VRGSVLLVEPAREMREALGDELAALGVRVFEARDAPEAFATLKRAAVDLVVSELRGPSLDGVALLERLGRDGPPAVVMSRSSDVSTAVRSMRAGALDFVSLPTDLGELARRIAGLVWNGDAGEQAPTGLTGDHPLIHALRADVARVARRDVSVLITGESGVGKEIVARQIHARSRRRSHPFVAVNCCALSDSLLESELFGHEKGAFTGATARKLGRFERARGGTLFLDEIGDAPPSTQAKLLRVLQEREFERVGGVETLRVDVRLIAATNRDLVDMRQRGEFRDDLFHRLNVLPLRVPPLRERASDVRLLVRVLGERNGLALSWTDAALARLEAHPWPGNVRELENALERLGALCDGPGPVTLERVEAALDTPRGCVPTRRVAFEDDERARYEELLVSHRWNVSAVARVLGVSRGALRHRMRKYGL